MKKIYVIPAIMQLMLFANAATAQLLGPTEPVSAVSFPKEVIDMDSGRIEFFAKLKGFTGVLKDGEDFFVIADGQYWDGTGCNPPFNSTSNLMYMGFSSNNGVGAGGIVAQVGTGFDGGTGSYGYWTYEKIYGSTEAVSKWHCYRFEWNRNGLPSLNRQYKFAVYIDGKLSTSFWLSSNDCAKFTPFIGGTFDLIATYYWPPSTIKREVAMDELRIYNGKGKLTLYNTLDSKDAVENSNVGLNGSFDGFGNAHFVKGVKGYAVSAQFVRSQTTLTAQTTSANVSSASVVKKDFAATISPNPVASNVLNLRIANSSATSIQVTISDMQGKTFINQKLVLSNGALNKTIDVAVLPKGMYILKVINNKNEQQELKFVKAN